MSKKKKARREVFRQAMIDQLSEDIAAGRLRNDATMSAWALSLARFVTRPEKKDPLKIKRVHPS